MHLDDVQYVAVLEGRLHEIAIRIDDFAQAPAIAANVAVAVSSSEGGDTLVVRPWQEIMPQLSTMLELNTQSIQVTFFIFFLLVALGIVNSQRMSALERRREFGVLLAIGISPRRLGQMIVAETVLVSLVGAIAGGAMGLALSSYHATAGFDMSMFASGAEEFSFMGLAFEGRMYFVVTARAVWLPIVWTVGVAVICGFWPAFSSGRLNATQAISGRTN
jgi:ABC-type antimicrobial peptide transport system permease subunit